MIFAIVFPATYKRFPAIDKRDILYGCYRLYYATVVLFMATSFMTCVITLSTHTVKQFLSVFYSWVVHSLI